MFQLASQPTCETLKASLMGAVTLVRAEVEAPITAEMRMAEDVSSVT